MGAGESVMWRARFARGMQGAGFRSLLSRVPTLAQIVIGLSAELACGAGVPGGAVARAVNATVGAAHAT